MPMRWRWPPENSCGYLRIWSGRRPTCSKSPATRSRSLPPRAASQLRSGSPTMSPTRHARIERRVRVLEDDLHLAARTGASPRAPSAVIRAVDSDRARRRLDQPQDRLAGGRLAAAGLADEAERLACRDREADAVDRVDLSGQAPEHALPHREVLRAGRGPGAARSCRCLASRRSAFPSMRPSGPAADSSSGGYSAAQRAVAYGQRGAKRQPRGTASFSVGTMPGISARRLRRAALAPPRPGAGSSRSSPCV